MKERGELRWLLFTVVLLAGLCAGLAWFGSETGTVAAQPVEEYVVLAWNDLGMHCYNANFDELGVLPPWNTLWAQVVKVGDPPEVITQGVRVTFSIQDNSYSVGKSNFWDSSPYRPYQNAQWLFNLADPLPPDTNLTGVTLSGDMEARSDHFVAEGIPLTEYRDSQPNVRYPYMLAEIVVYRGGTTQELARTQPVAPVSTEMHCEVCHYDNGPGNEGIATGVVERNILTKHDQENLEDYPPPYEGMSLMSQRPVLCAKCHPSNALPMVTSALDHPSMTQALHETHAEEGVGSTLADCYQCHPGPETQCLRGVMATKHGMVCSDCHGDLQTVAQNPDPWLNEPRCDNPDCHGSSYTQDQALYRFSKDHGGIYCEACHDSTHAIAPSREPNDAIKFIGWQRYNGPLSRCSVCHDPWPTEPGPHGFFMAELRPYIHLPTILRISQ